MRVANKGNKIGKKEKEEIKSFMENWNSVGKKKEKEREGEENKGIKIAVNKFKKNIERKKGKEIAYNRNKMRKKKGRKIRKTKRKE